jgi:DNA modification methylase
MAVRIITGDCRDVLRTLPDESVHCVVTSPPYWGLRDYGVAGAIGLENNLSEFVAEMVKVFADVRRILDPAGTLWLNLGDCYANDGKWGGETGGKQAYLDDANRKRVGREKRFTGLKPKDLCGIPWRVAFALQDDGWWLRSEITWGKPNAMPDSSGRYRPGVAHEKIFMLSKSADCFYDHEAVAIPSSPNTNARVAKNKIPGAWDLGDGAHGTINRDGRTSAAYQEKKQDGHGRRHSGFNGRYFGEPGVSPKSAPEDSNIRAKGSFHASTTGIVKTRFVRTWEPAPAQVWVFPTAPYAEAHYATFPPELVERCLKAGCPEGGTVLDPFGGAGTVGLVAELRGRNSILIEINPEYAAQAEARINGDHSLFELPKLASQTTFEL